MPPDKKVEDMTQAPATPARTKPQIQAELAAAKARLAVLLPLVEADRGRVSKQAERIATKRMRWKVDFPDEPFDPDSFSPPMRPFQHDEELNREFHALHYTIKGLEDELAASARSPGLPKA